ncbi:MAG: inositol monophosphatase [Candidatus Dormibacteraeota bacterium]|nr:inositol monophosphatase [Candidatus Dormibacteraeota bacterium]
MADRAAQRQAARDAAEAAASVVRHRWNDATATTAEEKGAGDYVTAVDREAEAAAIAVLRERTPDIEVLAEERGGSRQSRMWVVDPVDGTTNLVRGFPVVGVSVALLEEGRPVVGAVAAPQLDAAWSAADGEGAADARGRPLRIADRPPSRAIVATGFPFKRKDEPVLARYISAFEAGLVAFEDLRRAGAASLDLAYTANATFDGFFELGLSLWDIAAGALLVREAGGVVTDWAGDPDQVFTSGDIIAGSPRCHEAMLEIARP